MGLIAPLVVLAIVIGVPALVWLVLSLDPEGRLGP